MPVHAIGLASFPGSPCFTTDRKLGGAWEQGDCVISLVAHNIPDGWAFCHLQYLNTADDEKLGRAPGASLRNWATVGASWSHVTTPYSAGERRGLVWLWLGLVYMYATKLTSFQLPCHTHPLMRNRLLLSEVNWFDLRVLGGRYLPSPSPGPHWLCARGKAGKVQRRFHARIRCHCLHLIPHLSSACFSMFKCPASKQAFLFEAQQISCFILIGAHPSLLQYWHYCAVHGLIWLVSFTT